MYSFKNSILFILILAVTTGLNGVNAQGDPDITDKTEELRQKLKSESFNMGALILTQANFAFDKDADAGTRGFTVPQVRFILSGNLDGGFSYKIQADFSDQFTLLDAEIGYELSEKAMVIVGSQQPGISAEYLTAPHKIDFYTRSYPVVALAQERDFGIRLAGDLSDVVNYSVGMFNGNGLAPNNNNNFYYVGRLGFAADKSETGQVEGGVNLSYGEMTNTEIAGGVLPNIDGDRFTYGGDVRYEDDTLILSAEVLAAHLEYTGFTESDNVYGFHVTGGYKFDQRSTVLARYETLQSDLLGAGIDRDRVLIGYKGSPTTETGFRINYLMPLNNNTEFKDHGMVMTMHIGF